MTPDEIEQLFDKYAELRTLLVALETDHDMERQAILAPVADELAALEAELGPSIQLARQELANIEATLKAQAIEQKETLVSGAWQVVYTKPSAVWDTQALELCLRLHNELGQFKRDSKPSATVKPKSQKV